MLQNQEGSYYNDIKVSQYLYSTNSCLSFIVTKTFFGGKFFVWCSPVWNPKDCNEFDLNRRIPHSSSPHGIFTQLSEEIATNDMHSKKIEGIRASLSKVANKYWIDSIITESECGQITEMVNSAPITEFKPFIYVINRAKISEDRIIKVAVKDAANPLSTEFQIHDLRAEEFEIIKF